MINLLPPEEKKEIIAGRANTLLRRYLFGIFLVGLLIAALFGLYFWQLNHTLTVAQNATDDNKQVLSSFQSTINKSQKFQSDLRVAKQILSKEVDYSGIILKIGAMMPPGTILSSIALDPTTIGKEVTISAQTKTYQDAITLKEAMQKSGLFTDVHFLKISQTQTAGATTKGPYTQDVTFSVKFDQKVIK